MSYENSSGRNVYTQYGTRDTGVSIGTDHSRNAEHELTVEITANELVAGGATFLPPFVVPKGARFTRATLSIHNPITITGTLNVGGTAPGTNGVPITAANLANAAATAIDLSAALAGTWATASAVGTTAAERVTTTGPTTVTKGNGHATLTLRYVYKQRA